MRMGPRVYGAVLLVLTGIAAVAFVKLSAGDRTAPTNSLTDQPSATFTEPQATRPLHQPTILRADSAAGPEMNQTPIRIPIRLSAEPPRRDEEVEPVPAPADLTPTEFLTIPSLDPPRLR